MLSSLTWLVMVFSAFTDVGPNEKYAPIFQGPDRNHWVDARIGAAAARANVLVTNDAKFRERVNLVAKCIGIQVRAVALAEFVS